MGCSFINKCSTNYTYNVPAPNPNPERWQILNVWEFPNVHILKVKYLDATNYEGVKLMIYKGKFPGHHIKYLDPHFSEDGYSPIARFRPDTEGIHLALTLAELISGQNKQ